jgi:CheY-like chemotaxis protein
MVLIQRNKPSPSSRCDARAQRTRGVTAIKADPTLKATRVILLTSKAMEGDVEAGLIAGADFYLTKPFSPLDLLTRVEEALQL